MIDLAPSFASSDDVCRGCWPTVIRADNPSIRSCMSGGGVRFVSRRRSPFGLVRTSGNLRRRLDGSGYLQQFWDAVRVLVGVLV